MVTSENYHENQVLYRVVVLKKRCNRHDTGEDLVSSNVINKYKYIFLYLNI